MAETWVINEKIITKDIVTDDSRTISFPVNAIVKNNIGQYKAIDKLEFAYTYDEYGDDDYDCGNAMRGFFHIHRDEGEFEYLVSLTEYMYGSYEPEGPYEYVRWYGYYREDGTQGEYEYTSPDAMKIITFLEPPTGDLLIWLQSNAAKQSSQISIDLTTLSGWSSLSEGNHTVTVKSKATDYRDSRTSEGVTVIKSSGETWVINQTPNVTTGGLPNAVSITFVSNDQTFHTFSTSYSSGGPLPLPAQYVQYDNVNAYYYEEYARSRLWRYNEYKTVYFPEPPTGELLTWLQSNAVKQ